MVEQRELQDPAFDQVLDRRSPQGSDPIESSGLDVCGEAGLGDHATVADQHDVLEREPLLQFLDLGGKRHGIASVALEHLDRDGATVGRTEQAVDDLQCALPAVPAVAAFGKRTAAAFHVAGGDIVEHQCTVPQMLPGQRRLDGGLALQQPVECGVKFVFIDIAETQHGSQARCGRGGGEGAGGGELRAGIENAPDDHGQHEVAAAVAVRAEDAVEADLVRRAEGGADVAMRQRTGDGEGLAFRRDDGAAFEHAAQALDMRLGPTGEITECPLSHLAVFAVALAQQDGRGRVPVGDGFDVHGGIRAQPRSRYKSKD